MIRLFRMVSLVTVTLIAAHGVSSSAHGDDPFAAPTELQKKTSGPSLPAFSEAREAAALVFVKQNSPELLTSLDQYRKLNVPGYQQAIRQFFQWSELSSDAKFKDADGIKLALRAWKAQFESQLLSAKLMSDPSRASELKDQMRQIIENSVDLQIAQAKHQIAKTESQLVELRAQTQRLISNRDETVSARLSALEAMVSQRISLSNIPEDLRTAILQVQEATRRKAAQGQDVSKVIDGMRRIESMIRDGETDHAMEILQKALEYLNR